MLQFFHPAHRPQKPMDSTLHARTGMSRTPGTLPPERLPPGGIVYYGHYFYITPEGMGVVAGTSRQRIDFSAAIWKDNFFAAQFHPKNPKSWSPPLRRIWESVTVTRSPNPRLPAATLAN